MEVTVEVVGGEHHDLSLPSPTYGDLLRAVGLSEHEATVLVNGRPVPEDAPVETDRVRVLQLVSGG